MPKHIQTLDALDFCVANGKLYFVDDKSNFCSANKIILPNATSSTCIAIQTYETHIILNDSWNYGLLVYDHTTDKTIFKSDDTVQMLSRIDPVVIGENLHVIIQEECENYGLLNLTTGNICRISFEACHSFPTCSYVFNWIKNENLSTIGLAAINPETGSEVWRFTEKRHLGFDFMGDEVIEEIGEIFGVCNNRLWLSMAPERIVALNLQNGSTEREYFITHSGISSENKYIDAGQCLFHIGDVKYVPEEKKLIVFNYNVYGEFDLTSANPTWDLYDVKDTFTAHDMITVGNVTIRGNLICFNYTSSCKIAVFDRTQKKIVWSIDLKEIESNTTNARKIDMTDTHIYALDRNQHLFVFERSDI